MFSHLLATQPKATNKNNKIKNKKVTQISLATYVRIVCIYLHIACMCISKYNFPLKAF